MHNTLIKPIITEKSMEKAGKGQYTFAVAAHATKHMIMLAIEKLFNVHVQDISIVITKEKMKRVGKRRVEVMMQPQKKAVIRLATGEKIALFETKE